MILLENYVPIHVKIGVTDKTSNVKILEDQPPVPQRILVVIVQQNLLLYIEHKIVNSFLIIKRFQTFLRIIRLLEKHAQILVEINVMDKTLDARILEDQPPVPQRTLVVIVPPKINLS